MQHQKLINKLADCIAACQHCADACLSEDDIKRMVDCIRTDRDCADACALAMNFVARDSSHARKAVEFCRDLCQQCAEECGKHDMDHCQQCAQACRECEQACAEYIG
jgi:hypothetical protein